MDDLSQRLEALLSSPDSLAKLQGALAALGVEPDGAPPSAPSAPPPSADPASPSFQKPTPAPEGLTAPADTASGTPELSSLAGLLPLLSGLGGSGGGAPELGGLMKFLPLLSAGGQEDENTALLRALRPYLHGEREKRLDGAIKLLQISRVLPLLK